MTGAFRIEKDLRPTNPRWKQRGPGSTDSPLISYYPGPAFAVPRENKLLSWPTTEANISPGCFFRALVSGQYSEIPCCGLHSIRHAEAKPGRHQAEP